MPSMKTEEVLSPNSIRTKSSAEARLYSSRRLSRDLPIIIDTSFDVYYRESSAGNTPFLWESQPGTPKIKSRGESPLIPPLTPPPSFNSSPRPTNKKHRQKIKNNLVPSVLLKKKAQQSHHQSPSESTSSSWSTRWSTSSSPLSSSGTTPRQQHSRMIMSSSSLTSSFDSRIEEVESCDEGSSPVSTSCFRACWK